MDAAIRVDKTLAEIATMVGGRLVGDKRILIKGLSGIKEAQDGDLTFLANIKYAPLVKDTKASAILVGKDNRLSDKPHIIVDNPSYAFALIIKKILKTEDYLPKGIHPTAVIASDAMIGKAVAIGPHAVIESKVTIGDGTRISAGCYIGHATSIGRDCFFYPNVTIRERLHIGNSVIIHSGSVIGADGFGFELVEGIREKIPQIGTVIIEDDVEIGANTTIDRARFDKTQIGQGTKIDNLVQIGHNVLIGKNCIIVAGVGIAGSVVLKDGVILAGQSGVAGHITIGEGAIATAQAGVTRSVPPGTTVSGFPAMDHGDFKKAHINFKRLPLYVKEIKELAKRVEALEKKIK